MRSVLLRPALALALCGLFALPQPVHAQAAANLSVQDRDWAAFLGPFPVPGSETGQGDVAILLWLQRTRTRVELARAGAEVIPHPALFSEAAGVDLESGRFPLTLQLLGEASRELREVTGAMKRHFERPRPFLADPRIKPAVTLEHSFSYPSGHGAWGVLNATLLAGLDPARGAQLLERGRQVGNDRVLGGVHYPSDVEAGQRLGAAVGAAWLLDPVHRRLLEEARAAEWVSPTGR